MHFHTKIMRAVAILLFALGAIFFDSVSHVLSIAIDAFFVGMVVAFALLWPTGEKSK